MPAKPPPPPAQNNEALESSILAAIAQAVDVLVEDSGASRARQALPPPPQPVAEEKPEPLPSEGGDSDDIGDEIQRIIASYSRARRQGDAPDPRARASSARTPGPIGRTQPDDF